MKFYYKKCENLIDSLLPKASISAGKFIGQTCLILDIRDISTKQINKDLFHMMERQFKVDMNYYPELLGTCLIVNNSFLFQAIWAIASGFIHESTRNKVKFFSEDFKDQLLKVVDAISYQKL